MNQPMEYTLKSGEVVSDLADFIGIVKYYEAYCTAEYIEEEWNIPEEICLDLGYEVRRRMDKYEYRDEADTIECFMHDFTCKVRNWVKNLSAEYSADISMIDAEIDTLDELLGTIFESEPLKDKFLADKYQLI